MNIIDVTMIAVHMLAAVVWVGGMFLAYRVLRPAAMEIDPPYRLTLWLGVFSRFFKWVWLAIFLIVITGYWDWSARFAAETSTLYIEIMQWLGWLMIAFFSWLYFKPFQAFKKAVQEQRFPDAGAIMQKQMRPIIAINLTLGTLEVLIGASGIYW
ncbi:CopD family protein [Thiomicrorhabdus sp. 6S3-12]|uniref:CopD family protein n=1 Tax=Thiomicrorhabdus sp. 6S3-12 TaxID=2819681 RepID=UPI001AAD2DA9|nr:CopD family protein [Thiomicrorhabdus sp. 6S3-12]MBO1924398.1 CopD family protein [Thiomicrorhabdus sp. 6S3-12]